MFWLSLFVVTKITDLFNVSMTTFDTNMKYMTENALCKAILKPAMAVSSSAFTQLSEAKFPARNWVALKVFPV